MTTTSKFLEAVREHRESKKREKFSGVLEDYLKLIEEDRNIPDRDWETCLLWSC